MSETTQFLAIGHYELGDPLGDTVTCPHCGAEHAVIHAKYHDADGNVIGCGSLSWYKCGDISYIAGINSRALRGNA